MSKQTHYIKVETSINFDTIKEILEGVDYTAEVIPLDIDEISDQIGRLTDECKEYLQKSCAIINKIHDLTNLKQTL